MFGKTLLVIGVLALAGAGSAQDPAGPTPAPAASPPAPVAGESFRAGAEVLSIDGEPLGVLAYVDTLEGERMLHIRRPDGTVITVPSTVASQGERAVVLEWSRTEFETPSGSAGSPIPPSPQ
jgi:C-terminal processing protease CtpA/Prc